MKYENGNNGQRIMAQCNGNNQLQWLCSSIWHNEMAINGWRNGVMNGVMNGVIIANVIMYLIMCINNQCVS